MHRLVLILVAVMALACSSQSARPVASSSSSSPPPSLVSREPARLRPLLSGVAGELVLRGRALAGLGDALRPWLSESCSPLPPGARLVAARILSGAAGEKPDAGDERSTVERPVYLYAELELEHADGRRETLRAPAEADESRACVQLTWHKLEPTISWHSNKDGDGRSHFTPIPYAATPFAHGWRVLAEVHPTILGDQFPELPTGVGVMHYQLVASLHGQTVATAGADTLDRYGTLDESLPRVSYRPDTGSWLDYTFELFNTPYVWGSLHGQVEGQLAADCADLAVYAWRRAGNTEVDYTWSYGMRHVTELRAEVAAIDAASGLFVDEDGESLVLGRDIEPGDIILLRRHIAVFYRDADGDGLLGVDDEIIQTNWHEPERVSFADMRYEHDAFEIRRW